MSSDEKIALAKVELEKEILHLTKLNEKMPSEFRKRLIEKLAAINGLLS